MAAMKSNVTMSHANPHHFRVPIYSPCSRPSKILVKLQSAFSVVDNNRIATRRARPRTRRRTLVRRLSVPSVKGNTCGSAAAPAVKVNEIVWSSDPSA